MPDTPRSFASTTAYRQQARHLRAKLRNNPAALHKALSTLNGTTTEFRDEPAHSPARSSAPPAPRRGRAATNRTPTAQAPTIAPAQPAYPRSAESSTLVWAITTTRPIFDLRDNTPTPRPVETKTDPDLSRPTVRRAPFSRASDSPRLPRQYADLTRSAIERGFATAVEQHLHGAVLKQSDRAALLRAADRMQLDRFRANLIIALVQRAAATGQPAIDALALAPATTGEILPATSPRYDRLYLAGWVTLAAMIEFAIAALAWRIWM